MSWSFSIIQLHQTIYNFFPLKGFPTEFALVITINPVIHSRGHMIIAVPLFKDENKTLYSLH